MELALRDRTSLLSSPLGRIVARECSAGLLYCHRDPPCNSFAVPYALARRSCAKHHLRHTVTSKTCQEFLCFLEAVHVVSFTIRGRFC